MSPQDVIASGQCIGCGLCASREPAAAMEFDQDGHLKPRGPEAWLTAPSARFAASCPFSPAAVDEDVIAASLWPDAPHVNPWIGRHRSAWVGHGPDDLRMNGSSGGLVTWIAGELLRQGLVGGVAHVAPTHRATGRLFSYTISRRMADLRAGAKSRYYPIDLAEVLREIRASPGRYAVVGVPCFIKAVQLARRSEPVLAERIAFTVGLFCGHLKSARMSESFSAQMDLPPARMAAIDYRRKDASRPANWYTAEIVADDGSVRSRDWWHLDEGDWGAGFFMNPACNWCDDVAAECADVALGDAWLEPWTSDGRGTNVVVVRSPVIEALVAQGLAEGRLTLQHVEADLVRQTQAAGFRHRREGLAYRLALLQRRLFKPPIVPRKRVAPSVDLSVRRKLIYRARWAVTRWSHVLHRRAPGLYHPWARRTLRLYQALAWSRGWLGAVLDRLLRPAA